MMSNYEDEGHKKISCTEIMSYRGMANGLLIALNALDKWGTILAEVEGIEEGKLSDDG